MECAFYAAKALWEKENLHIQKMYCRVCGKRNKLVVAKQCSKPFKKGSRMKNIMYRCNAFGKKSDFCQFGEETKK